MILQLQHKAKRNKAAPTKKEKFPTVLLAILIVLVLITVLINFVLKTDSATRFLSADSSAPDGAGALITILTEQGIDVVNVENQAQLHSAGKDSTVVIVNPEKLAEPDVQYLQNSGARVVLLVKKFGFFLPTWQLNATTLSTTPTQKPTTNEHKTTKATAENNLDNPLLSPQHVYRAKHQNGARLPANCTFPPALAAQEIFPVSEVFRGFPENSATCFHTQLTPHQQLVDTAALITAPDNPEIFAFSAPVIFTNIFLADAGNAAFAMNLFGENSRLYWVENYTTARVAVSDHGAPQGAHPHWLLIFAAATLAVALWFILIKSRRFGKLVPEPMPVVVPSGETNFGRARLYARSKDYAHLARILRNAFLVKYTPQVFSAASSAAPTAHTAFAAHSTPAALATAPTAATSATQNSTPDALALQKERIIVFLQERTQAERAHLTDLLFTRTIQTEKDLRKMQEELQALAKELSSEGAIK